MNEIQLNNKDKNFKGQHHDEEVITFYRAHWVTLLPHFLMYLFGASIVGILTVNVYILDYALFSEPLLQIIMIALILVVVYCLHRFFIKLINFFLHTVIITNLRVVELDKSVFLKDDKYSFDMKEIQDIQKQQDGFWKNILKFGELVIMMSSSDVKVFKFVPNPDFHFRLINRIKREYIQKRILQKDSAEREHQELAAKIPSSKSQISNVNSNV